MSNELILKAIESAKCRVYKLNFDLNGNISAHHQKKAENQKELMEVTIEALEKQIPKKPIKVNGEAFEMTRDGEARYEFTLFCPTCNSADLYYGFPCKCGQKLDWGD